MRKQLQKKTLDKEEKNREVVKQFIQQLYKKNLTPEEFFRAIDSKNQGQIENEKFKRALDKMKLLTNEHQIKTLISIIDEDFSGDISIYEFRSALLAYNIKIEANPK